MMDIEDISAKIHESKKYSFLCEELVTRICAEEANKGYGDKEWIKAVKNRLHQLYGAFLNGECHKKASVILDGLNDLAEDIKKSSAEILRLHASTDERLAFITEFYDFIFAKVGEPESILDVGCGFNPFSLPWMATKSLKAYHAIDIDYRTAELINRYFHLLGKPTLATTGDIVGLTPSETVEVAFVFKLIPVLEGQAKGRGFSLLKELNARFIVVTYPTKSLSGKSKGMMENYSSSFESTLDKEIRILHSTVINNELIYILSKKPY